MINAYQAGVTYEMGDPWIGALRQLATTPESGTFMVRGEYAIVEVGPRFVFPPIKLQFTTDDGVLVRAGDNFVILDHEITRHILWRQDNIPNHPEGPMVA